MFLVFQDKYDDVDENDYAPSVIDGYLMMKLYRDRLFSMIEKNRYFNG